MAAARIMLFPMDPGRPLSSERWGAMFPETTDTRLAGLESEGSSWSDALGKLKAKARAAGYRGRFSHYVDTWGNF